MSESVELKQTDLQRTRKNENNPEMASICTTIDEIDALRTEVKMWRPRTSIQYLTLIDTNRAVNITKQSETNLSRVNTKRKDGTT